MLWPCGALKLHVLWLNCNLRAYKVAFAAPFVSWIAALGNVFPAQAQLRHSKRPTNASSSLQEAPYMGLLSAFALSSTMCIRIFTVCRGHCIMRPVQVNRLGQSLWAASVMPSPELKRPVMLGIVHAGNALAALDTCFSHHYYLATYICRQCTGCTWQRNPWPLGCQQHLSVMPVLQLRSPSRCNMYLQAMHWLRLAARPLASWQPATHRSPTQDWVPLPWTNSACSAATCPVTAVP